MRCVLQRVNRASVSVGGTVISNIDRGVCVLVGISGIFQKYMSQLSHKQSYTTMMGRRGYTRGIGMDGQKAHQQ